MAELGIPEALMFEIKRAMIGTSDLTMYKDVIEAIYAEGLPACRIMGAASKKACKFVCCPACEVGRRATFGIHVGNRLKTVDAAKDGVYVVHQRVTANELHELASTDAFNSSATWRFFQRLDGLVAWRINAGFDLGCRVWVFDRVAVVIGRRPSLRESAAARGVVVRGFKDFVAGTGSRLPEVVGEYAGILEYATNLGPVPLDILAAAHDLELDYVIDSVHEAKRRWKQHHIRLHLVRTIDTVCPESQQE